MTNSQDLTDFQQLFSEYIFALDDGDPDGVAACFTVDGVYSGGQFREARGRDAIRQVQQERMNAFHAAHPGESPYSYRRHFMMNPHLVVTGVTGSFRAYVLTTMREGDDFFMGLTGTYTGTVQRVDGAWRFKERHVELDSYDSPYTALFRGTDVLGPKSTKR